MQNFLALANSVNFTVWKREKEARDQNEAEDRYVPPRYFLPFLLVREKLHCHGSSRPLRSIVILWTIKLRCPDFLDIFTFFFLFWQSSTNHLHPFQLIFDIHLDKVFLLLIFFFSNKRMKEYCKQFYKSFHLTIYCNLQTKYINSYIYICIVYEC